MILKNYKEVSNHITYYMSIRYIAISWWFLVNRIIVLLPEHTSLRRSFVPSDLISSSFLPPLSLSSDTRN
jgi:hypothetical protein